MRKIQQNEKGISLQTVDGQSRAVPFPQPYFLPWHSPGNSPSACFLDGALLLSKPSQSRDRSSMWPWHGEALLSGLRETWGGPWGRQWDRGGRTPALVDTRLVGPEPHWPLCSRPRSLLYCSAGVSARMRLDPEMSQRVPEEGRREGGTSWEDARAALASQGGEKWGSAGEAREARSGEKPAQVGSYTGKAGSPQHHGEHQGEGPQNCCFCNTAHLMTTMLIHAPKH